VIRRQLQCAIRYLGLAIFLRVEAREVLANNLVGLIPFKALCAGVPAIYVSVAVQQVDCIILDGIDKDMKSVILREQGGSGISWCFVLHGHYLRSGTGIAGPVSIL